VSAADINRPDTDQPSGHRPRFRKQQRTSTASAVSGSATPWTPAAVSGWAAGCGRTAADPLRPFRHHGSAARVALARLCWARRPGRRSRLVAAVRTHGHRTRPAGQREPARPGTADAHDCRGGMRALRQRPRWMVGSSTVHHRQPARRPPPEPRPGTARSSAPTSSAASRRGFPKFAKPPATYPCRLSATGSLRWKSWVPASPTLNSATPTWKGEDCRDHPEREPGRGQRIRGRP
jgi:hypothetical protein